MEHLQVVITCTNGDSKYDEFLDYAETMVNATRMLLTYKPKRGYKIVEYKISVVETLV